MNENFSQLYKNIYDFYKKSEFSRDEGNSKLALAKFLGVSQGKTQHWEKGQWPSAKDIENIHKKLGISCSWLVTGEGEMFELQQEIQKDYTPVADQSDELVQLRAELEAERRLNRQLTTRLLIDGTGDKDASKNIVGKTANGQ